MALYNEPGIASNPACFVIFCIVLLTSVLFLAPTLILSSFFTMDFAVTRDHGWTEKCGEEKCEEYGKGWVFILFLVLYLIS